MRRNASHLLVYLEKWLNWMIKMFYFTLHNKADDEGGFLPWEKR